jgi:hypothetical protein
LVGAVCVAGILRVGTTATAGGDDIAADRPGFGESAAVVGRWQVQLEAGFTWTRVDSESRLFDIPQALVRVGLGGSLELRVLAPDWLRTNGPGGAGSGWTDTAIGFKWHVAIGGNDLSLRGTAYLPSGSTVWSNENLDPEGAVAWSRDLSAGWSLGATVGLRRFGHFATNVLSPSLSIGRTMGPHASTFVEYGASVAEGSRPLHRIDHGYAWLPNPDTQLDVSLGLGLSAAAPDFFLGFGFSRRF